MEICVTVYNGKYRLAQPFTLITYWQWWMGRAQPWWWWAVWKRTPLRSLFSVQKSPCHWLPFPAEEGRKTFCRLPFLPTFMCPSGNEQQAGQTGSEPLPWERTLYPWPILTGYGSLLVDYYNSVPKQWQAEMWWGKPSSLDPQWTHVVGNMYATVEAGRNYVMETAIQPLYVSDMSFLFKCFQPQNSPINLKQWVGRQEGNMFVPPMPTPCGPMWWQWSGRSRGSDLCCDLQL